MLKGKRILLGVTGSIAAYKAAILVRLLVKNGAEVKIIMTPLAKEFITPLTLATLSKNPILVDFFNPENGDWNSHVDLGLWADLYLVAPATANTIAKMATGVADNLLLTSYLSARCPVMVVPAMDLDMYQHVATQNNLKILQSRDNIIVEPATGELASGLEGKGRMEEPENILKAVSQFFASKQKLAGKTIMVTAGPTYEAIDPVRFIGNHSSGKMGYAIAEVLAEYGAKVVLISGPVKLSINNPNIQLVKVTSANEMYNASVKYFAKAQAAIMAAAVADYTLANTAKEKLKRKGDNLQLELIPTKDIAAELGTLKTKKQVLAGFALETNDELKNAQGKLKKKNFDFIVLNSLAEAGAGFNFDTNKITIVDSNNNITQFELKSKREVAVDIVEKLCTYLVK
jgi:phosphopantothenoylcysteine decarboxylase/phosphopantothenate--cysteine ligase